MQNDTETKPVSTDSLVDIRNIHINKALPREQRINEFMKQIKDPYHFKCGPFTVHVGFTANGMTLEECIAGLLR